MPRILTVDDSASIRKLVRVNLQKPGFAVEEANNGAEGLKALARAQFDLIILDIMMPVMDGVVMLRMKDSLQNKTPVILLTAEVNETLAHAMANPCVMDYLKKPLQPAALCAAVTQVLGLSDESA